jgi:two-component system sensor histidine kinase AlgZ
MVVSMVVITEFTTVLLALAGALGETQIWARLFLLSLYLQWIGLVSAAVLCLARRLLVRSSVRMAVFICYLLLLCITAVISVLAYRVAYVAGFGTLAVHGGSWVFLLRSLAVCAIVSALTLRYFFVQNQWREQVHAHAETRFQALQARIRPHFLFNSLNSIAALIPVRPAAAEETVLDLAEVFRITLRDSVRLVPLADELEVTRRYLNIETTRLGNKLEMEWRIDDELMDLRVPLLCLQPLLENGVYHGIQLLPQGGKILVTGSRDGSQLRLEVVNPVPERTQPSRGQRLALDNIRERLRLIYGGGARLEATHRDNMHHVTLHIPVKGREAAADETADRG